jgi:hypothetical protein
MSFEYEDIPNDFVDDYKKMEIASIEALQLTQESVIAAKNLSDLKSQEKDLSENLDNLKTQIESSNETTLSEKKQELENQLSNLNGAISKAQINAKNASESAKEATTIAVDVASSKVVGKEIKEVTKKQIQNAYIKSHDAFAKALEAQGKNYYDEITGTVLSTFDLDKFKAATDANVAASAEWNAIKSLAHSQNPVAANNAIKEIQKAIDRGEVDDIRNNFQNSAATEAATQSAAIALQTADVAKETADKAATAANEAAQTAANEVAKDAASVAAKAASEAASAAKEAAEAAASEAASAAKEAAEAAAVQVAAAAKEAAEAAAAEVAATAKAAAEAAAAEAKQNLMDQQSLDELSSAATEAFQNFIDTPYSGDGSAWKAARQNYLDASQKHREKWTSCNAGTTCD